MTTTRKGTAVDRTGSLVNKSFKLSVVEIYTEYLNIAERGGG